MRHTGQQRQGRVAVRILIKAHRAGPGSGGCGTYSHHRHWRVVRVYRYHNALVTLHSNNLTHFFLSLWRVP